MAARIPLVVIAGQVQQLPSGDTISGIGPTATTVVTRVLGTAFQPSTTRATLASYTAKITSTLSLVLSTGQSGQIELLCDAANPPTTVRARVTGGSTGSVAIALTVTDTTEAPMTFLVPAGWFVLLRATAVSGAPTMVLTAQVEQTL